MREHIECVRNRVTALASRLFRRPLIRKESGSPLSTQQIVETSDPPIEPHAPIPEVNYRDIALGYFADVLSRSAATAPAADSLIETLAKDNVLKGTDRKKLKGLLERGTDATEIAQGLAELLPAQLQRKSRRTLLIWQEQENRRVLANSNSPGTKNASPDHGVPKDSKTDLKPEDNSVEPYKAAERTPTRNYSVGRLIRRSAEIGNGNLDRIEVLDEQQILELIKERANKLAAGDQKMMGDCIAILDFLRENPSSYRNPGIKRLSQCKMSIEGKALPIWSLNPRNTPELNLSHRQSGDIRATYAIYEKGGQRLILLDGAGIYNHEQYDKRYLKTRAKYR